ncbi:MAG TPA: PBP1A family penicillin-binding protein [Methylomirabilota bacterium]|nr:PBP1A family penicillin-binding protein [Methylomirabilota bacterium]
MARKSGKSAEPPRRRAKPRRWPWTLLRWGLLFGSWGTLAALCFLGWLAYDLPDVSRLNEIRRQPSITLLADDGSVIASYGDLYGQTVKLSDLPAYLPHAVIATEDRRFYHHFGLDPLGLARAAYINLRYWRLTQGGSTITQQLAKNVFLTPARTVRRKGQEMLLALWLEHNFTKDQILTLYLNRVYFGAGAYGVDAAARKFFGKPATQVTPYEAAMLAGLLRAPSQFNPVADRAAADSRARLVLQNMVDADFLSAADADNIAKGAQMSTSYATAGQSGRHFSDWVLDQVSSYVGFVDRDLVVTTTLDPRMQKVAETQLAQLLDDDAGKHNAGQAALVSLTPDGAVRAMVGGRDYANSQFNRATQALRQPGSAFKAFVYLAGLEHGLTPEDRFVDSPLRIGKWQPDNFENKYYGNVSLREAFARSLNSVAVQVSERVGRSNVIEAARRLGITADLTTGPSIALGSSGVSLLELTGAYATFDNGGYGVWPRGIETIRDKDGRLLYRREGSGPGQLVEPAQVNGMLDLMSAVVDWGTGRGASPGRPAAGKTGTSSDSRDAWFVGFTAELVTGVWVGNDDNSPMKKVTGGGLPAQLWRSYMVAALDGQPARPLPQLDASAQVASANPVIDGAIPRAVAAEPDSQSTSLQDWLSRVITQQGSRK